MKTIKLENYILKLCFIMVLSFLLGMFIGWKITAEIDSYSIKNLYDKVENLEISLQEAQHDLFLDSNRIQYLEKQLQELTGEVQ